MFLSKMFQFLIAEKKHPIKFSIDYNQIMSFVYIIMHAVSSRHLCND